MADEKAVPAPWWVVNKEERFKQSVERTREKYPQATLAFEGKPFSFGKSTPEYLPMTWGSLSKRDPGYATLRDFMLRSNDPDMVEVALLGDELDSDTLQALSLIARSQEYGNYLKQFQTEQEGLKGNLQGFSFMSPEKQAFEISQTGKPARGFTSEDRYQFGRQQAETSFIERRSEENQKRVAEQEKRMKEMESKRQALKGPRDWMKYMIEIGEKPSWLDYWLAKR